MDFLNHALDALLRWPVPQARLAGSRRIHSSERVAQKIELSLQVDKLADAERIFEALSKNGTVKMPLAETFWAQRFGMLVDQFGTPWMINYAKPAV